MCAGSPRSETLNFLRQAKVPPSRITLFVQEPSLKKQYAKAFPFLKLVMGSANPPEWNAILHSYYPEGTPIVVLSDAIKGFLELEPGMLTSFSGLLKRGFLECEKTGARLWGIYPVAHRGLLEPTISTDLQYISGAFFGIVNPGDALPITSTTEVEYERTALYYKTFGSVVRFNMIAPILA